MLFVGNRPILRSRDTVGIMTHRSMADSEICWNMWLLDRNHASIVELTMIGN